MSRSGALRWKAKRLSFLWRTFLRDRGQRVDMARRERIEADIAYVLCRFGDTA